LGLLNQIENLEGSASIDGLFGGGNDNTLLGRPGEDFLSGGAGADFMSARSDDDDTIDCGAGADNGRADPKPLDDSPAPVACESLPRG
jgi:Ca2+-binding RTX toxin-like protein